MPGRGDPCFVIVPFGKHEGKQVWEIIREDPEYLVWCASNFEAGRWRKTFLDALEHVHSMAHGWTAEDWLDVQAAR